MPAHAFRFRNDNACTILSAHLWPYQGSSWDEYTVLPPTPDCQGRTVGRYCWKEASGRNSTTELRMKKPSWSCTLLAMSFWKTPSSPCMQHAAQQQSSIQDQEHHMLPDQICNHDNDESENPGTGWAPCR